MSDESQELLVDCDGPVTTLTLNRPAALNALNGRLLQRLGDEVTRAEADDAVRVVVITGAGERAFSVGADLKELRGLPADRAHDLMRTGQQVMRSIERAQVPVIAAVNGIALGGGFELVLAATFPVLATSAALGLPEATLGLIPGYGGTQRLPRVVGGPAAAHLMLTGSRLGADRAHALGLTPLAPVPPEELAQAVRTVAEKIADQGPRAVRSILTALEQGRDNPLDAGLALETGLATLALTGTESDEGISAFLERRSPHFAATEGEGH